MSDLPSEFRDAFPDRTLDAWRALVERDLKGADFAARLVARTFEGIDVQPLYAPHSDAPPSAPALDDAHHARGRLAERRWEIAQHYDELESTAAREAIALDLGAGVEALRLRFARPMRTAVFDTSDVSDSPFGRGLAVRAAADVRALLPEAGLGDASITVDVGANIDAATALFCAAVGDTATARGSVGGDPLDALLRDGALPGSLDDAWDAAARALRWRDQKATAVRAIVVSAEAVHDAGADAVTELAVATAGWIATLRALDARGISLETAAKNAELRLHVGRDVFMEIAKLRAARLLWHRVLEACGAPGMAATMHLHASSSLRARSTRDPWVNMLRGTSEAFAAIVGGADSVGVAPFDAAVGASDRLARRVARNTQLVLRLESHLDKVVDPAGGSWAVERLTNELADHAWEQMQALEAAGGLDRAILDGRLQARVAEVAERRRVALRKRREVVVGVSEYADPSEATLARTTPSRDVVNALWSDAAQLGATLAVSSDSPTTAASLTPMREGEAFEAIADRTEALSHPDDTPHAFIAAVGDRAALSARLAWTERALEAGALRVVSQRYELGAAQGAAADYQSSGAVIAVLVARDDDYGALIPTLTDELRRGGARAVFVAGRVGGDGASTFDAALYVGCDLVEVLERALDAMEASR